MSAGDTEIAYLAGLLMINFYRSNEETIVLKKLNCSRDDVIM